MPESRSAAAVKRSATITASGIALIFMAILFGAIAGLFVLQGSMPRPTSIEIGGVIRLPFGYGYDAALLFMGLFVLCGYAGTATLRRWRGGRLADGLAAGAMIVIGAGCTWLWLTGGGTWFPFAVPLVLLAVAAFVLLAQFGKRLTE